MSIRGVLKTLYVRYRTVCARALRLVLSVNDVELKW